MREEEGPCPLKSIDVILRVILFIAFKLRVAHTYYNSFIPRPNTSL